MLDFWTVHSFRVYLSFLGLRNEALGSFSLLPHDGDPRHSGQQPGRTLDTNGKFHQWNFQTFLILLVSVYKPLTRRFRPPCKWGVPVFQALKCIHLQVQEDGQGDEMPPEIETTFEGDGLNLQVFLDFFLLFSWQIGDILVRPDDQGDPSVCKNLADPLSLVDKVTHKIKIQQQWFRT